MNNMQNTEFQSESDDDELIELTGFSMFSEAEAQPSPYHFLDNAEELIDKIIETGTDAYIALHQKKAYDSAFQEGVAISAQKYAAIQNNYAIKSEKFFDYFIEFHQSNDPFYKSAVKCKLSARNLLMKSMSDIPNARGFEIQLTEYFSTNFNYNLPPITNDATR